MLQVPMLTQIINIWSVCLRGGKLTTAIPGGLSVMVHMQQRISSFPHNSKTKLKSYSQHKFNPHSLNLIQNVSW